MMNTIKMIHTIARYYNTEKCMTNLFRRITNQMIENCKRCILGDSVNGTQLWDQDLEALIRNLESCLKLNESYQEQYQLTKEKLATTPNSNQFNFNESQIFGKFN